MVRLGVPAVVCLHHYLPTVPQPRAVKQSVFLWVRTGGWVWVGLGGQGDFVLCARVHVGLGDAGLRLRHQHFVEHDGTIVVHGITRSCAVYYTSVVYTCMECLVRVWGPGQGWKMPGGAPAPDHAKQDHTVLSTFVFPYEARACVAVRGRGYGTCCRQRERFRIRTTQRARRSGLGSVAGITYL